MLLNRLLNMPLRFQQAVALAMAATCMALVALAMFHLISIFRAQSGQIAEMREHAGKLSALASLKDEALRLAAASVHDQGSGLLLEADSLPIAKVNMQSRMAALAQTHGVTVASSGAVPDLEENGLLLIGLRADLSGTNDAIGRMVSEVETMKPPLLVREFTLRSEGAPLPDREPALSATIKVYAAVRNADKESYLERQRNQADGDKLQ